MAVVESAVSFLVQRLGDLLAQKVSLLSGVRGEVEWVETELLRMKSFLIDADRSSSSSSIEESERMKNLRREVRDLVNAAEDAIDMFILTVEPLRRGGGVFSLGKLKKLKRCVFIHKEAAARRKVASEIADIKLKLSSLSGSRATYGIEFIGQGADATGSVGRRIFQEHRLSSLSVPAETDFVGFEKELLEFIPRLTSKEQEQLCIFSVVGMGGLGKTTFATKIYNDSRVKEHFEERGWASVSQQPSVTGICTALLACFKKSQNASRDGTGVISGCLTGKRYLIVLDDVWTKDAWDALKGAFPDSGNGSRVLLTTRNQEVASHANPQIQPHELRVLNRNESMKLFLKKAFPEDNNCPPLHSKTIQIRHDSKKTEIGKEIVGKCGGLPLAIVAVGGMLAGKSITEWRHVCKSISWQLGDQGEAKISGILKLSYKDLPYDLKPCFLYLAIFPEDEEFRAKQVIQMWAAEGLLQQRGDETVEEVGEDCVRALVRRSMIQVAETSSTGGIKSCRIHDLSRDIAVSEAKGERFLQVQRQSTNVVLSSSAKSRRQAIYCDKASINESISSNSAVSQLRSMFIYSQDGADLEEKRLKSLYRRYKLLRVLYLHNVNIRELPSVIGDLIHLRYFGIVGITDLRSLPPSIGNLRSLQTLTIGSSFYIEIPRTIQKMQELRHLRVKCEFDGQPRLEQISNLHTLKLVKAGEWVHNSLEKLKSSLRKLGITLDSDAYYQSIAKLDSLQSLSLASPDYRENESKIPNLVPLTHLLQLCKLSLRGRLEQLPEPSGFPPNLTKLTLSFSRLDQDAVATLEKLQNLRILRLLQDSYMGQEMNCSAEGFPSLEDLLLKRLPNLATWIIGEGAMRKLAYLRITDCKNLERLPAGVECLPDLKKLKVRCMPRVFNDNLQEYADKHTTYDVDVKLEESKASEPKVSSERVPPTDCGPTGDSQDLSAGPSRATQELSTSPSFSSFGPIDSPSASPPHPDDVESEYQMHD